MLERPVHSLRAKLGELTNAERAGGSLKLTKAKLQEMHCLNLAMLEVTERDLSAYGYVPPQAPPPLEPPPLAPLPLEPPPLAPPPLTPLPPSPPPATACAGPCGATPPRW